MNIADGLLGDKSTMARDIYLAEQMDALADIVDAQFNVMRLRIDTLEMIIAGPNLPQSHLDLAERMMGLSLRLTTVEKLANEI